MLARPCGARAYRRGGDGDPRATTLPLRKRDALTLGSARLAEHGNADDDLEARENTRVHPAIRGARIHHFASRLAVDPRQLVSDLLAVRFRNALV